MVSFDLFNKTALPNKTFEKKTISNILIIGLLMRKLTNSQNSGEKISKEQQKIIDGNKILETENNDANNTLAEKTNELAEKTNLNDELAQENAALNDEIDKLNDDLANAATVADGLTATIQQQQQTILDNDAEYTKQLQLNNTNEVLLEELKINSLALASLDSTIEQIIFSDDMRYICPERQHSDQMLQLTVFDDFKLVIPLQKYFYDKFGCREIYAKIEFNNDEHNSFKILFTGGNIYVDTKTESIGTYASGDIVRIVLPSWEYNMIIENRTQRWASETHIEFESFCQVASQNFFNTGLEVQWLATTFPKETPEQLKMPMDLKLMKIDRYLLQTFINYEILKGEEYVFNNENGEIQIEYSEKSLIKVGKLEFNKCGIIVSEIIDMNFRIGIVMPNINYETSNFENDDMWQLYYQHGLSPKLFAFGQTYSASNLPFEIETLSLFFSKTINSSGLTTEFINIEVAGENGVETKTQQIHIDDDTLEYDVVFESNSTISQIGLIPYVLTQNLHFFKNFNEPSSIVNGIICEQINESEVVLVTMPKNKNVHALIYLRESEDNANEDNIEVMSEYDNILGELFVKELTINTTYEVLVQAGSNSSRMQENDGGFYQFYIYYDKFKKAVYYISIENNNFQNILSECVVYKQKNVFLSEKINIIYKPGSQIEQIKYNEPYFTKINPEELFEMRVSKTLNAETNNFQIWSSNSQYTLSSYLENISVKSIIGIAPCEVATFFVQIDPSTDETFLLGVAGFFDDNSAYKIQIYRTEFNFDEYASATFHNKKLVKANREITIVTEPENELKITCNKLNISIAHNGYAINFINNEQTTITDPFFIEIVAHSHVRIYNDK